MMASCARFGCWCSEMDSRSPNDPLLIGILNLIAAAIRAVPSLAGELDDIASNDTGKGLSHFLQKDAAEAGVDETSSKALIEKVEEASRNFVDEIWCNCLFGHDEVPPIFEIATPPRSVAGSLCCG